MDKYDALQTRIRREVESMRRLGVTSSMSSERINRSFVAGRKDESKYQHS